MHNTIRQYFTWRKMKAQIEQLVARCDICQRCKKTGKNKYGKLLLKDDNSPEPFVSIAVNLDGSLEDRHCPSLGGQNRHAHNRARF